MFASPTETLAELENAGYFTDVKVATEKELQQHGLEGVIHFVDFVVGRA